MVPFCRTRLDHTPQLLTLGTLSSLQHLLDRTAAAGCAATPQWQQVQGMLGWARWDFALMRDAMQQAEAGYRAAGQPDRALQALAYQSAALVAFGQAHEVPDRLLAHDRRGLALETHLMVLLARQWHAMDIGRLHDVGPLLDETMDLLETTTDPSLWYRAHTIPRLNGLPGTARALDRYTDGVLRLTADQPSPLRAMAHTQRALRALWRGQTDEAQEALDTARADARWLGHPPNVNGTLNLGLALLAAAIGLLGRIGTAPALLVLTLYALLPIVHNTCTGLAEVPSGLKMAATALGLTGRQRLRLVELPLALPVILTGVRTATTIAVGTATIAAFIGAGGYGERIVTGLALNDHQLMIAGALPAALLALLFEGGFALLGRRLRHV